VIARRLRQRQPSSPLSPAALTAPVPAVLALSERGAQKGLLPSLPPGIRVSRPHNFPTLFLEKIGKVDPISCPPFPGRRFERPDVGCLTEDDSRKVKT
jgi:hypothetical protein